MVGFAGIAISTVVVAWVSLVISLIIIHGRYAEEIKLFREMGWGSIFSMLVAGGCEWAVLYGLRVWAGEVVGTVKLMEFIGGTIIVGGIVYVGVLMMFRNEEIRLMLRRVRRH